ncbi:DUF6508 domain-containing protein [Enterobacter asburiae]
MLPPVSPKDIDDILAFIRLSSINYASETSEDDIIKLIQIMDERQFIAPFDWISEFSHGRDLRLYDAGLIVSADLELLRKIMVAHVRLERFSTGHLSRFLSSPAWGEWQNRLAEIRSTL